MPKLLPNAGADVAGVPKVLPNAGAALGAEVPNAGVALAAGVPKLLANAGAVDATGVLKVVEPNPPKPVEVVVVAPNGEPNAVAKILKKKKTS